MRPMRWLMGLVILSAITFTVLAPGAQAAEIDLRASLHGSTAFTRATGFSEYDRSSTGREVEVTVRNIGGLAGHSVTVYVSGDRVGTMLVSSAGVAHRQWDTERGQFVPFASAGDSVKVRTAGGTLVASGRYVREAGD
jgi:hypothetical protein